MFVLNFCEGGNKLRDQMFQAIIQANIRYQSKVLSKRVDLFYLCYEFWNENWNDREKERQGKVKMCLYKNKNEIVDDLGGTNGFKNVTLFGKSRLNENSVVAFFHCIEEHFHCILKRLQCFSTEPRCMQIHFKIISKHCQCVFKHWQRNQWNSRPFGIFHRTAAISY